MTHKHINFGRFHFVAFESGWILMYKGQHMASWFRNRNKVEMPRLKVHVGKFTVEYW